MGQSGLRVKTHPVAHIFLQNVMCLCAIDLFYPQAPPQTPAVSAGYAMKLM